MHVHCFQVVGFLWGYYIQQFGATFIILAAGFIVSCLVSTVFPPEGVSLKFYMYNAFPIPGLKVAEHSFGIL